MSSTVDAGPSPRVTLRRFPYAVLRGLADGTLERPADWHPQYETTSITAITRMLLSAYEAMDVMPDDDSPWWVFAVVVDGVVVGDAGFHGPPAGPRPVEVEIGYQVVPALRGRGVATRACALLLEHAWRHGADRVLADTEPENVASRAVLRRCGFRASGADTFAVGAPGSAT